MTLERIRKLMALAFDESTSEEERRTAAEFACRGLCDLKLLEKLPAREKALEVCQAFRGQDLWEKLFGARDAPLPPAMRVGLCDLCHTSVPHVHGVSPEYSNTYIDWWSP